LTTDASRPVRFTLRLEGFDDPSNIYELRRLLKILRRRYGFRCVGISEEVMGHHEVETSESNNDGISARDRATEKA
jgi:hypothetical protein